jgi:Ca2+-binding EF-hand superfamily protein
MAIVSWGVTQLVAGNSGDAANSKDKKQEIGKNDTHSNNSDKIGDGKSGLGDDKKEEQGTIKPRRQRISPKLKEEIVKKYAKDGDGKLNDVTLAQLKADLKKRRAEFIKKYDKNGDGKLSPEELEAARKDIQQKQQRRARIREQILKKYNKDSDGKLNPEELKAAREEIQQRRAKVRRELVKRYTKNGTGKLNDRERAQLQTDRESRRAELIQKFDKDGDGKLNEQEQEEACKYWEENQKQRRKEWKNKHSKDGQ